MKNILLSFAIIFIATTSLSKADEPEPIYLIPKYTNTGNNASIVVYVSDEIYEGCEIGVWAGELLIGSGVVYNRKAGFAIWGDNSMTPIKDGASENELLQTRVYLVNSHMLVDLQLNNLKELTQQKDYTELIFKSNGVFTCNAVLTTNNVLENNPYHISLTPNPFTENIIISFPQTLNKDDFKIILFNLLGQNVTSLVNYQLNSLQDIVINTANLKTGIYIISISDNKNSFNKIMVKNE